ncbi:spermidine hydroxycinnamoyl transferase-like [Gastrolobium bilobum]|uniref:spermidine hydroxycinnamoyl transferase-like n=1 Tax=Gastrolobium bilobum TaxID=150636 RepID=UPI002AB316CE|nr:spermidine hydroxycinnamoyl transferase-like [Gastrolobium bilobum]
MVSVERFHRVIPCEPTPGGKLSLSSFDQYRLYTHIPLLHIYRSKSIHHHHDDASVTLMETLTNSLSKALVHYYPLAGRLCAIHGGRWELNCNSMGVHLFEAHYQPTTTKTTTLDDFALTQLLQQQLMPKIPYNPPIEDMPLLVIQLTSFPCGGLTLGVAISRVVLDGVGFMVFLNSWAKLARGENLDPSEIPCYDRALLNLSRVHILQRFQFHHPEFQPPPLWVGSFLVDDTKYDTIIEVFKLTKAQVQKLKERVLIDFGNGNSPQQNCTSFEVISGLLWRCVCKARFAGNGDQPTRVSTLVHCRNRLKPPVPNSYFGNVVLPTVTRTCTFDDVIYKPLSYAVGNIREALRRLTDEYIRSALQYIADQKDVSVVRNNVNFNVASAGGQFRGNPSLSIVSWMNFPFQDADFGWGKPVYLLPGNINSEGKAFIMNNGNGDADGECIIVAICLLASNMDAFKKFFYEDVAEVLSSSKL